MSKFFNKKRTTLKISNPINFSDAAPQSREISPSTEAYKGNGLSPDLRAPPINTKSRPSSTDQAIILISKHKFQAHNSKELTVAANEPLKLLSRQGNGWVLVKPIGRLGGPGLVPSAYCSIVNTGPSIDDEWLNGSDITLNPQVLKEDENGKLRSNSEISASSTSSSSNNSMDRTSPTSLSSMEDLSTSSPKQSTTSISVKTVSSHKGRYWYRTDVVLPHTKTRCLVRYYQDFYSLHALLCEQFDNNDLRNALPILPGPIPRPDPEVLLKRCHDLNFYIQRLVDFFSNDINEKQKAANVFKSWLAIREGDIELDESEYFSYKTEEINKLIDPVSPTGAGLQAAQQQKQEKFDASLFEKPLGMDVVNIQLLDSAEPSPMPSPLTENPEAFSKEGEPTTPKKQQKLKVDTQLECSPTSPLFHNNKPKLDFITERRNQSPVLPSAPGFKTEDYVRVKVIYNEGKDIIAMKMLRDSNLTILKLSISSKIQIFDYVLSYKDVKSGFFKPLRTNKDLQDSINKNKIVIKVSDVNVV